MYDIETVSINIKPQLETDKTIYRRYIHTVLKHTEYVLGIHMLRTVQNWVKEGLNKSLYKMSYKNIYE